MALLPMPQQGRAVSSIFGGWACRAPIHAHRVRVHLPIVHDSGECWDFCLHICGTLQTRTPGPLSQRVREHPITTRANELLTGALNRQPLERGVAGPWILRPDDVLVIQGDPTAGFAVHETQPSLSHVAISTEMKPAKHQGLAFLD